MRSSWLFAVLLLGCSHHRAAPPARAPLPAPVPWLKGQLHAHSSFSGDSQTPALEVARWYAAHGYDFLVLTDHEHVGGVTGAPLLVLPGVELTQNLRTCQPPPPPGLACLLHVNALGVTETADGSVPWPPATSDSRLERYRRALAATRSLDGLAQLNHPNFQWAADAELIAALTRDGLRLMEIANQSGVDNQGDASHPSTEALWDSVLAAGLTLYGTATDDAHHYDDAAAVRARGETAYVGDLGFVMVHAAREPRAIRDALARGDFYASTGVLLGAITLGPDAIDVALPAGAAAAHFRLIAAGAVAREVTGTQVHWPLAGLPGRYARAVVEDASGRKAWLQPVALP